MKPTSFLGLIRTGLRAACTVVGVGGALQAGLPASGASLFWDADGATSAATGGAGTWDDSSPEWRTGSATGAIAPWPNTAVNGDSAQLAGTAGTLTLNAGSVNINVNDLTFGTAGYIINGPASGTAKLNLAGATPTINAATSATIGTILSGSSGFTKTGAGALTLKSPTLSKTVDTTLGSSTVTMIDTTGIVVGDIMTGLGSVFPVNALVTALTGTTVTLSANALGTATATPATAIHPSTYTGQTLVNQGTLIVNGAGYVVDASWDRTVKLAILGASGAGNETVVAAGATVNFSDAYYHNLAESFTLSGTGVAAAGAMLFGNSNWTLTGVITLAGDSKIAGAQNGFSGTIDLGSSTLTISKNAAVVDTWSAAISGTGGLTLAGLTTGSTLILTGANTYTGATTILPGVLSVATIGNGGVASGNLGSATNAAANLVLGGGTLKYTGATASSDRNFTLTAATTSTIEVATATTNLSWSGAAGASTGALTKTGPGTLTLTGVQRYSGVTTVSAGTLTIGGAGQLGAGSYAADIVNNGILNVDSTASQTWSGAISGTGALSRNGSGTLTLTGPSTYSGPTTVSAGKLVISTAAASTSPITLNATAALGVTVAGSNQLAITALTLAATTTIDFSALTSTTLAPLNVGALASNGTTTLNIQSGGFVAGQSYPLIHYTTLSGAGALILGSLPVGISATLETSGNTLVLVVSGVNSVVWAGGVNGVWDTSTLNWTHTGGAATYANGGAVRFDDTAFGATVVSIPAAVSPGALVFANGAKNYTLSGSPIGGNSSLEKSGAGTVVLASANSYTGATFINAGIVQAGNPAAFGTAAAPTTVADGAQLQLAAGSSGMTEPLTINGTTYNTQGPLRFVNSALTYSGALTLGSDSKITGANAGNINAPGSINLGGFNLTIAMNSGGTYGWSAPIAGAGGGLTVMVDASTLTLTGANTYTGPTTVNSGSLSCATLGNGGAVSGPLGSATNAAANLVLGGGTLKYTGATAGSDRNFTLTAGTTGTIEIAGAATTLTLTGASAATNGALAKTGPGTLKLSGNNLHVGTTTISAGTLALGAAGSLAGSSEIKVATGAVFDVTAAPFTLGAAQTLRGTGTVSGAVTVNGTLAPGGAGTLAFNGPLNLAAGSTTVIEIARNGATLTSSRIQTSGTLTFGGTLVISNVDGNLLQAGDIYQFFSAPVSSGGFTNLIAPPGYTFDNSQLASGRIVVAAAPPPPGFTAFSVKNGTVALSWPGNYSGWIAQSNSLELGANSWMDLVGSNAGTSMSFPTDPGLQHEFYRLRSPDTADFASDPLARNGGLDIGTAWTGDVVGFDLLTLQDVQIAAYYNASRQLAFAARNLNSEQWFTLVTSEIFAGWDVHNYIGLSVDSLGYLHCAANMHNQPMNYFRSAQPVTDVSQFQAAGFIQQLPTLWSVANEAMSTYPAWFTGPNDESVFTYRSRTSGTAGSWHLLKYDPVAQTFAQATGANALFTWAGAYGSYNVYSVYPAFTVSGGYTHCLYVWRATDGTDNFRLSYLRSANLVNWTDAFGRALTLPLGPNDTLPIVDDVPHNNGLLNGQPMLSFDRDGVPLVAYSKFDAFGHSQVYVARPAPESQSWKIVKLTNNNSWGVILNNIATTRSSGGVGNGFAADDPLDGLATVGVSMTDPDGVRDPNSGNYTFDEITLNSVTGSYPDVSSYSSANSPNAVTSYVDPNLIENTFIDPRSGSGMGVSRTRSDGAAFANFSYYMRWEALPSDNSYGTKYDLSGKALNPPPSALRLYRTPADFDAAVYGRMFKPAAANLFGAMTRTRDAAPAFGTFLSSPAAGPANFAQWSFNVATAGDYALGASAYANAAASDSFWVQVDNGPLIDWRVSGHWDYRPVTSGTTQGILRIDLTAGNHSLRVYAQEAGTRLAYLWLNQPNLAKASSLLPLSYAGFTLTADAKSVSGYALSSPSGGNPAGSTAHYQIPVAQTGNYLLLGRTRAPSATSDSFNLAINGGASQLWSLPISGADWVWQAVGSSQALNAGTLDLDVSGREGGAALDSFMLLKVP